MTEFSELETFPALLERAWNNALESDNLFSVLGLSGMHEAKREMGARVGLPLYGA